MKSNTNYILTFLFGILISLVGFSQNQERENLVLYRPIYEPQAIPKFYDTVISNKPQVIPTNQINTKLDNKLDSIDIKNSNVKYIAGYRIQVYSGPSSEEVKKARGKIYEVYPEIDIYQSYKQPDYKLKVGNFSDKLEAHYALSILKEHFPVALITPETVLLKK